MRPGAPPSPLGHISWLASQEAKQVTGYCPGFPVWLQDREMTRVLTASAPEAPRVEAEGLG